MDDRPALIEMLDELDEAAEESKEIGASARRIPVEAPPVDEEAVVATEPTGLPLAQPPQESS